MIHPERRRENLKKIEEMDKQDALISRRQAVSRMSDLICLELKGNAPRWNDVYKAMNELPTVETKLLKEKSEWIPVSERLPNDNEDVLAYCVYEDDSSRIVPANYFNGEFYNCIFDCVMRCEITHWMPLPKPPQEEGEQE